MIIELRSEVKTSLHYVRSYRQFCQRAFVSRTYQEGVIFLSNKQPRLSHLNIEHGVQREVHVTGPQGFDMYTNVFINISDISALDLCVAINSDCSHYSNLLDDGFSCSQFFRTMPFSAGTTITHVVLFIFRTPLLSAIVEWIIACIFLFLIYGERNKQKKSENYCSVPPHNLFSVLGNYWEKYLYIFPFF